MLSGATIVNVIILYIKFLLFQYLTLLGREIYNYTSFDMILFYFARFCLLF